MTLFWLIAGLLLTGAALFYAGAALLAVSGYRPIHPASGQGAPPVTVLKPLCGDEPELEENLASIFQQNYGEYEIVFGVRDRADPALSVVERLRKRFPERPVSVVADPSIHGTNLKISNLINMFAAARHDLLVIADSDIRVGPDYLSLVTPALSDPQVGVVTCAYLARPVQNNATCRLAALQINEWFLPSVLVARALGRANFCLGSTMAVRRDSLAAIGGLPALKDLLADDYMLGRLLNDRGYRVDMAPCLVETTVPEDRLGAVLSHELRWARTIRTVEFASFLGSGLMYTIPVSGVAAVFLLLSGAGPLASLLPVALAVAARLALHAAVTRIFSVTRAGWWLVPIRDILSFGVWAASFTGRSVVWRGQHMQVDARGVLTEAVNEV